MTTHCTPPLCRDVNSLYADLFEKKLKDWRNESRDGRPAWPTRPLVFNIKDILEHRT